MYQANRTQCFILVHVILQSQDMYFPLENHGYFRKPLPKGKKSGTLEVDTKGREVCYVLHNVDLFSMNTIFG